MLFNACNTTQNLLSSILDADGFGSLGFYSLGVYYFVFGITSLWAMPLIKIWGDKVSFVVGCAGFTLYTAA
jgi:hypothetical protein